MDDFDESYWMIETIRGSDKEKRVIRYSLIQKDIDKNAYNSELYVPIVLAPLNKLCVFVISAFYKDTKLCLCLHDLRVVNDEIVSSFNFLLRGNDYQIKRFKNEMNRSCDDRRCIGLSFLFRKLFNCGFHTIYAEKILRPKTNSSLKAAVKIVQAVNESPDEYSKLISSIGEKDGD
jgi:hypothetical protein